VQAVARDRRHVRIASDQQHGVAVRREQAADDGSDGARPGNDDARSLRHRPGRRPQGSIAPSLSATKAAFRCRTSW
jgi:hypothetical protein